MPSVLPDDPLPPPVPLPRRPRLAPSLPAPATSLVGRERELAAVADLLADPDVRLVTLVGPGGVGKTRLALAALAALAARAAADAAFANGAAFVDLAPVSDPTLVPSAIAAAIGVLETADEPLSLTIASFLRSRQTLLVLDNFEHLLAAAAVPSALIAACPHLTLLVTSRALLRLSGEHAYPVAPLALPDPTAPPETVVNAESVRLFAVRARAARPDFRLADANAPAVAAICRRLDGLPLAIELAAARVAAFTPSAMLDRLERRLPVPMEGPRDAPARQRTLAAAIAWSHDLLSPADQALFRRLGVFVGGFSLEAAEEVAVAGERLAGAAEGRQPASLDVVGGVVSLVEQGLLQGVGPAADERDARYTMLETVRAFALDRLAASGEEEAVRRHHADVCVALVERLEPELWGLQPDRWLDRLEDNLDNLRAALASGIEQDPGTALRLAGALWRFWEKRNLRSEGRSWLERGIADADAEAEAVGLPPVVRAKALAALGAILSFQDEPLPAIPILKEAVALYRSAGERFGLARALHELGNALRLRGQLEDADALWSEALAHYREPEDRRSIAELLRLVAYAAFHRQDLDRAEALFERALALTRGSGDREFEAKQLQNLSVIADHRGNNHLAAALAEEAIAIHRAIGDRLGLGHGLLNLSVWVNRSGDAVGALAMRQESLALAVETENREGVLLILPLLAEIAIGFGYHRQAARFLGACYALREAHGIALTEKNRRWYDDELLPAMAAALGDEGLAASLAAGRLAALDVVVADALALRPPAPGSVGSTPSDATSATRLTARELDVLRLLVDGRADKEIAAALFISRPTVSKHVETIRGKLGVDSRTAAVALAVRHGLV